MNKLLGAAAPVVGTILDFLGVAGLIIFGTFIVVLVVDLILSATSEREGIFFNKKKKDKVEDNDDVIEFNNEPVAEQQQVEESATVDENGVVFYNRPYEDDTVTSVDFDKAIAEQQSLQSKLDEQQSPENDFYAEEDDNEEDIESIALEVAKKAVAELEAEALEKEKKVFKVKAEESIEKEAPATEVIETIEEKVEEVPVVVEETPVVVEEVVQEEPIIVEQSVVDNSEEIRRLEEERLELERQVALLRAEREKDKEEILLKMLLV